MKKKIFALLMTMVLVLSMGTTALADTNSPVGDNTQTDSPVGDNTPVGKAEVDVIWSTTDKWTVEVENVTPDGEYWWYDAEVLKDGEYVDTVNSIFAKGETVAIDISECVVENGSGKYIVEVYVNHVDSETQEWVYTHEGSTLESRIYVKPSNKLATPANLAFDLETGKLTFGQVEDADHYNVYMVAYMAGTNVDRFYLTSIIDDNTSDGKVEEVFAGLGDEIKAVEEELAADETLKGFDYMYAIEVCAVSADIEKALDSDYAQVVVIEHKLTKEEVKENFDKAFEGDEVDIETAAGALAGVSNETIVEMLETDAAFVEKVEKLDEACIEELGDSYKGATSKTETVDASKVKVVGVAINGDAAAESIELSFADVKAEDKVAVPEEYKAGVQLDISLLIDEVAMEDLYVPVTITMPIPAGVEKENLVILHYHGDATIPDVIVPTVNADGTMTFIVSGFSTFVVTNEVVEEAPAPTPEAPKTGDASTTTFVCSLLFLAAGFGVFMLIGYCKVFW